MARIHPELVLRHLAQVTTGPFAGAISDEELLERFRFGNDNDAFAVLVRRHGRLVWGACRRLLDDEHDAEDVLQATFLILAKRSHSIRKGQSVGSWLYCVASRLASRVRTQSERRQRLTPQASVPAEVDPLAEVGKRELKRLLDAELQRLPERLRAPLLLCYLEGQTQEEAAARLGWTKTTLRGRLERGREQLRRRLAKIGLPLSAATFPAALTATAEAAVPAALIGAMARAAVLVEGAPFGSVSPAVHALVRGMGRSMLIGRVRSAVILVLFTVLGTSAAVLAHHALTPDAPAPAKPDVASAVPTDAPKGGQPATDRYGDSLPQGALARLGSVRLRHAGNVVGIAYAADGKSVLSTGSDARTVLWDAATGRELRRYIPTWDKEDGRYPMAASLALAPDGHTLAVGYSNGSSCIRLFDADNGRELARLKGHAAGVSALAFTPDGKRLISGGWDDTIRTWELPAGKELRAQAAKHTSQHCLALSPDGGTMASGGDDKKVRLWDVASGRLLHEMPGHADTVTTLTFAPDGRTLVSGAPNDRLLRVWDVASGKPLRTLKADGPVAFSPDGGRIATGGGLRMIVIWKAGTNEELRRFAGHKHNVSALAFAPDGRTLVSGGLDGTVRLWDPATGKELSAARGHEDGVNAVAFSPDGKTVVTGGDDSTTRFWDPATGTQLRLHDRAEYELGRKEVQRAHNPHAIFAASFLPDGRQLAIGGYGICQLVDPATGKQQVGIHMGADVNLSRLALSRDGKTLAWTSGNRVHLCDAVTGKLRHRLPDHKAFVRALAFSPDAKQLATTCDDATGTIRFWDVMSGKPAREIKSQNTQVSSLAFSPDGRTLAAGGSDARFSREETFFELWDLMTGHEPRRINGGRYAAGCLTFSPDGAMLATSAFTELHLWEVATGRLRVKFPHAGGMNALAFSPDGRSVVTVGRDSTGLVWDLTGGRRTAATVNDDEWIASWKDLRAEDAPSAYRAMWTLVGARQTVAALRERLKPLAREQATQIVRWVADLNSESFAERQHASDALEKQGYLAEPALRQALEGEPALELRRRVEHLLEKLTPPSAERLRERRAMETLGHIHRPESQGLLEVFAQGATADRLTLDARAILAGSSKIAASAR